MVMIDAFEQLIERLKLGGEGDIEAKSCQNTISKSVYETINAYSNTRGGQIILGVNPVTFDVEGVDNPILLKDQITATVCNKGYFNHSVDIEIEVVNLNNKKQTLLIKVNEDPQKPLYFVNAGLPKGALKRVNASNIKMNEYDLKRMYQLESNIKYEELSINRSNLDDIDDEMIQHYKNMRFQKDPKSSELDSHNKLDFLQQLNCVDSNNQINRLGILCFGTTQAFQKYFPMTRIDFISSDSKTWGIDDSKERYNQFIRNHTSLLRQIISIRDTIKNNLRTRFTHDGEYTSREIKVLPDDVIDESITNAILHRDYQVDEPIMIVQFSNRLEIKNPGYSLKPMDSLEEYGTKPRNPNLANIFHNIGYAETTGSGIKVIIDAMKKADLDPPNFEDDNENNYFKATFLFQHLLDPEFQKNLSKFKRFHLNSEDIKTLAYVFETLVINNKTYRSLNRVDSNQATKGLKRLVDKGLLESCGGSKKKTEYKPTKLLIDLLP